jgi:hypothetical protein
MIKKIVISGIIGLLVLTANRATVETRHIIPYESTLTQVEAITGSVGALKSEAFTDDKKLIQVYEIDGENWIFIEGKIR